MSRAKTLPQVRLLSRLHTGYYRVHTGYHRVVPPGLLLKPPSACCTRHWLQPSPPLRLNFLLATAATRTH